jgi:hypothetical protein
MVLYL